MKENRRAFLILWKEMPDVIILNVINEILKAALPYLDIYIAAQILNELAGARNIPVLRNLVLVLLCVTLAAGLVRVCIMRWKNTCESRRWTILNKILSEKLMDMDFCDVDDAAVYEKMQRIQEGDQWDNWGLSKVYSCFVNILQAVFTILGAIVLTVSLFRLPVKENAGWIAALNHPAFIFLFLAVMLLMSFAGPILGAVQNKMWLSCEEEARYGNRIFGFYGFMVYTRNRALDMRLYRQEQIADNYFVRNNQFCSKSKIAKLHRGPKGMLTAASEAVSVAFIGAAYLFVCLKCWGGAFPVGSCTQYIGAITALSGGVTSLMSEMQNIKGNVLFLRRMFEFLDIPNNMYQGSLTVEKRRDRNYEIEFRDVSFRYPGSEILVLNHINMKFRVGERLAVVGENGSGKTTFIKLLCRLYDPTEGTILLNGIDIRKYDYREYMSIFSVVFQDFQLLSFGLGENVAAGREFDQKRAEEALRKAGFGERLDSLQTGLDTILYKDFSDEGIQISGGEAQKIAIARALYHDAPFIILDEPTAALDPVAEYEIYSRFNEIVGDRTAIYISHRLSSCRFCDEIVVFHEGSVIEQGSHEMLLKKEGKYNDLWNAQACFYN